VFPFSTNSHYKNFELLPPHATNVHTTQKKQGKNEFIDQDYSIDTQYEYTLQKV